MINWLLSVFWLLAPAGFANMAPILFKWVPFLDYPVDFKRKFRGKRVFGSHKTIRGIFFAVVCGIIAVYLQKLLYPFTQNISMLDYSKINVIMFGILFGLGAMIGDCVESFFKRQIGIKPGKSWIVFDQIDWVIGTLIILSLFMTINWKIWVTALPLFFVLDIICKQIGYLLKLEKTNL